jgi:single-stranded-DNA-specific exonuclease
MIWKHSPVDTAQRDRLAQSAGVSPRMAEILIKRGLETPAQIKAFLAPLLSTLTDPALIKNLQGAVDRLIKAMAKREDVLVFGDYDVDGVTSTTLLVSLLKRFGLTLHPLVPRRMEEGYGLSLNAIDRALKEFNPKLFIAVDCGTNSVDEVAFLKKQGIDVIIIDHHTSKLGLPDCLLINPHVHDADDAPWKDLCTVGLIFKLAHGLLKTLRTQGDEIANQIDIKEYLDLVAMGTIADMVPLKGENRTLARAGLERLRDTNRLGLSALFEVSGMRMGEPVKPYDISFRLSPRINASGRLADATLPIQMLLSRDEKFCRQAAMQLDDYNRERQEIEKAIYEEALKQVEPGRFGYVLYNPNWHSGVVGVVASRLSHDLHRPCIVLGGEGEFAKGSGRSIDGVNLVEVLSEAKEYLRSWGGHPMATGVSLDPKNLEIFRELFNKGVEKRLEGRDPERILTLTAILQPQEVNPVLLGEMDNLYPYGIENPVPIFALEKVQLAFPPDVFGEKHFRFQLPLDNGRVIWGVAWNKADRLLPVGKTIDIAFELSWNAWKGRKYMQATLVDWR